MSTGRKPGNSGRQGAEPATSSEGERGRRCPFDSCDGGGWLLADDGTAFPCECLDERVRRARNRNVSSVIPRRFRGVGFDRPPVPDLDPHVVAAVRSYVDEIDERLRLGAGLWFMGDVGTGKTTLAMIVSKEALRRGHTVAIYSLPKLLSEIRKTYDRDAADTYQAFLKRLASVELLHIDDVGAEKQTEWVLEQLYSLINERYEHQRAVMITTNLGPDELREQVTPRTVSRLVEICGDPLPLFGADMRTEFHVA